MLIEEVLPNVVGGKAPLRQRFVEEARSQAMTLEAAEELLATVPRPLIDAECFLDAITGVWRYEFGLPHEIGGQLLWGTHMWVPVRHLLIAIACATRRLVEQKRAGYLARLSVPGRHQATLVEMIPGAKLDAEVPADFEVEGLGAGNRAIDWYIGPHAGRTVLVDVKRRYRDFIEQMAQVTDEMREAPEPQHEPELMFRSVEQKFEQADPDVQLQGAWVVTDIQQNEEHLRRAFGDLDGGKVHFAIFGDWEPDAFVTTRRPADEPYLRQVLHLQQSSRFTFFGGG
jgi:hypothetical protein